MTTSSWISPSNAAGLLLIPLLVALSPACSDSTSDEACWEDDDPVQVSGFPSEALHRARVKVVQISEYEAGVLTRSNSATAAFTDITYAAMKSRVAELTLGDPACYGLTGAPYKVCNQDPPCTLESLDAQAVRLEGLAPGDIDLERTSKGRFAKLDLPDPIFGTGEIKALVTGSDADEFFPTYEQSLPSMGTPMEIREPDPTQDQAPRSVDIKIRWDPGDGDFIVVDVSSGDPNVTDKAQCIIHDDGCHTLMAGILDWLEVKDGESFKLSVTRVKTIVQSVDANTAVELQLASQMKAVFTR
jgi:hypothetical protein